MEWFIDVWGRYNWRLYERRRIEEAIGYPHWIFEQTSRLTSWIQRDTISWSQENAIARHENGLVMKLLMKRFGDVFAGGIGVCMNEGELKNGLDIRADI